MSLIYACISALVICTRNKIVLVSRSKVWLCWGCARTCPCVRVFTAHVKGGSPAGEESNGYGMESSKTVGTVEVYYGASSSSSLLSSYCSGPYNSCWIFPLRMVSLLFESMWNVSSAGTGTASWGEKAAVQRLWDKSRESEQGDKMVWFSPCGRTCQGSNGNWKFFHLQWIKHQWLGIQICVCTGCSCTRD